MGHSVLEMYTKTGPRRRCRRCIRAGQVRRKSESIKYTGKSETVSLIQRKISENSKLATINWFGRGNCLTNQLMVCIKVAAG